MKDFEYAISRILDCGFTIEEAIPADTGKVTLGYGLQLLADVDNNSMQFVIKAVFSHLDFQLPMVTSSVLTKFAIKNLKMHLNDKAKFDFPSGAIETLFGISFSHLRAITTKNLAGSRHANFYLPLINQYELFNGLLKDNLKLLKDQPSVYTRFELDTYKMFNEPPNI